MTTESQEDDPFLRAQDIPRIEAALGRGVRAALRQHKQAGNPIAVWRDGKVVWIAAEDIVIDDEPDE